MHFLCHCQNFKVFILYVEKISLMDIGDVQIILLPLTGKNIIWKVQADSCMYMSKGTV